MVICHPNHQEFKGKFYQKFSSSHERPNSHVVRGPLKIFKFILDILAKNKNLNF